MNVLVNVTNTKMKHSCFNCRQNLQLVFLCVGNFVIAGNSKTSTSFNNNIILEIKTFIVSFLITKPPLECFCAVSLLNYVVKLIILHTSSYKGAFMYEFYKINKE